MRFLRVFWSMMAFVFTMLFVAKLIIASMTANDDVRIGKGALYSTSAVEESGEKSNQEGKHTIVITYDSEKDLARKLAFYLKGLQAQGLPILLTAFGLALLFYLLFILEGLQVAGLLVKDLDSDAIKHFLEKHPFTSSKRILPIHKVFHENFDRFVVGRQLLVIGTVVAMAFLNKSVQLPDKAVDLLSGALPVGTPPAQWFVDFLNGGVFAFVSSTFIPSWFSQLLPQFWADGRAIPFMSLPGTTLVLRLVMLLAQIQLGEPGHAVLRILSRLGLVGQRRLIPIGKHTYYEASLNFYGRAKKTHEIVLNLGSPTQVQERISYLFRSGATQYFEHKIHLAAPIDGNIGLSLNLPKNVFAEVAARDMSTTGGYVYLIKVHLNQALPRNDVEEDEVLIELEYQTMAYTDEPGIPYTTEFSSPLPVGNARLSIHGGKQLLAQPEVHIVERIDESLYPKPENDGTMNWHIASPAENDNKASIELQYPTIATVYQVRFRTIDRDWEKSPKLVSVVPN